MGWKKEKVKFFKKVEKEGKNFFLNTTKDETNSEKIHSQLSAGIEQTTVFNSTPVVSTEKEILIHNDDSDFIQLSKLYLDKEKMVGKGAYGAVYYGTLFGTIPVSIKKIYKVDFEEYGLKEMKFLKSVKSDRVLTCHGYSEDNDFLYVILEQMHCNLFQYLQNNPELELKRKIEIILEVARCIDFLHQQKIVHLDVKSQNILMNQDGSIIKIATNDTSFTMKASQLGTIGFQAPELYDDGEYGYFSDIYSFGIIMFEILFQKSPYTLQEMSNLDNFKREVKNGKRPNLEQFGNIKDSNLLILVGLMKQCWNSEKNKRPTVEEIIERLRDSISGLMNDDHYFIPFHFLTIQNIIGKGSHSAVYFGTLFGTIPVSIKKIYKVDFEESGLKEMKSLKSVKSDRVLTCHGYSEDEDFLYVILEQMHYNLSHYLQSNPDLGLKRKIEIILEVARCIDFLHQRMIVHLDLKSQNILLNQDGSVIKISDFQISKLREITDTSFTTRKNLGNIVYQSPELYFNGEFGYFSDIYSFGIMMFEILFQKSPFTSEELSNVNKFKYDVKNGKRPNLEQFGTIKDSNLLILVGLMKQCWNSEKKKRPTSQEIIEFIEGLEK
jgi:serine/threonine protein kinase